MIKPRDWPWIEFLSSRGQESQRLSQLSNNLSSWGSSRILQDKVRALGVLVLCSPTKHYFCCALLTLWCACACNQLKETHVRTKGCVLSAVLRWPHVAYGRNPVGGLYWPPNVKRHPMSPSENGQRWTKRVDRTLLSWSNFPISLTISQLLGN